MAIVYTFAERFEKSAGNSFFSPAAPIAAMFRKAVVADA
jgi:hypothetical protein